MRPQQKFWKFLLTWPKVEKRLLWHHKRAYIGTRVLKYENIRALNIFVPNVHNGRSYAIIYTNMDRPRFGTIVKRD